MQSCSHVHGSCGLVDGMGPCGCSIAMGECEYAYAYENEIRRLATREE